MLYIGHSFPQEFCDLMMHLRAKYPAELFNLDGIGEGKLDMHEASKSFFNNVTAVADTSIDSNANVADKSVINYNFEIDKALKKLNSYYNIWKYLKKAHGLETANQIIEMQITGDIYINDAWDVGRPYCFNYSTYDIALGGLPMGDKVKPVPPKSLYSFVRQVEQFCVYAANSTLGATGLADLLIMISWYVDNMAQEDGTFRDHHYTFASQEDAWAYVHEVLASLTYTLNWQFRGNQSPFTNISVYDREFLKEMVPEYIIDGKAPSIDTVWAVQDEFLKVMNEELSRAPLTFPVTTACFAVVTEEESKQEFLENGEPNPWYGVEPNTIKDEEFAHLIAYSNWWFGFINIYCGPSSTLSSCCRLRSDRKSEYFNSFGAGSSKIGSLGVVTLNLPRLAMKAHQHGLDEDEFFKDLAALVRVAAGVNNAKRTFLAKRIRDGVLPLYDLGFMDLKQQYSTCGVTGLYECCEVMGYDILTEEGQEFILKMLKCINATNDAMEGVFDAPHNCEQVPAENSSIKLAAKDALMGFDCGYPYYSNQFIPLIVKADMLDRIRLQGMFDRHFSGGAICHLNVAERIDKPEKIVDLIKSCAKQGVVYWAINYALNMCENGHMTVGKDPFCTVCGGEIVDEYTRVVGFLTNTKNWHKVRREFDWPKRQFYKEV